ncbi:MAG: hypothetical protein Q8O62_14710 [Aequorivita sp.]|nr:hypothetical protein [Aequorivita sp.]
MTLFCRCMAGLGRFFVSEGTGQVATCPYMIPMVATCPYTIPMVSICLYTVLVVVLTLILFILI